MKDKQSLTTLAFIVITFTTILGKSFPISSPLRVVFTIFSIIILLPYLYTVIKDKMFSNKLTLFCIILSVLQVLNVLYYTYILKK
ncbi:hypothetical protein [Clostridium rectalis]|uniref:hypothetical protein n=1 Tax=Clostridium rectalis TaxID=2040295 RepID=UPI000F6445B6|nr:hypothetical protein [Clostridium rectalis]